MHMNEAKITNFHYIDFKTDTRVPTQILNTQYDHQKITEQKVALDSSHRSNSGFHFVRLFCFRYSRSTKVVFLVTLLLLTFVLFFRILLRFL